MSARVFEVINADQSIGLEDVAPDLDLEPSNEIPFKSTEIAARLGKETVFATIKEPVSGPVGPPVVVLPGLWANRDHYDTLGSALAERGLTVITYDPIRSQGLIRDLNPLSYVSPQHLLADSAHAIIDEVGSSKNRLFGHSNGGATSVDVATDRPEEIESDVVVGSVGLFPHTRLELAYRSLNFILNEGFDVSQQILDDIFSELMRNALYHIGLNPMRSAVEMWRTPKERVLPKARSLIKDGVPFGAILLGDDSFFPLRRVLPHVQDSIDYWIIKGANHLATQSKAKLVALTYEKAIRKLEIEGQQLALAS